MVLAETLGSVAGWLCTEGEQQVVGLEVNANHVRSARDGEVRGFGHRQAAAQGLALALVVPGSLIALSAYASAGQVSWSLGLPMALGGLSTISWGVACADEGTRGGVLGHEGQDKQEEGKETAHGVPQRSRLMIWGRRSNLASNFQLEGCSPLQAASR